MRTTLVSEYRKFFSTRMWRILLLCMVGYMAFLAATFGWSLTFAAGEAADAGAEGEIFSASQLAQTIYGLSATLGYVFPVIVGALAVTGEFRHQTITPTLLAEPRRSVVLLAKFVSSIPIGLVYGIVGTLTTVGAGAGMLALNGNATYLGEPEVLRTVGLSVLAGALWALVGVGLGAALPNQVVSIVLLLVFTQFVEPMVRILATLVDWGATVAQFLPGAAGDALIGASFYAAIGGQEGGDLLPWWQGALILLGYAAVLGLIGRVTTFRKDIT
ncbi:MAG: ABC transporter permease subunit [Actinomycetales bacterium]|nr:ABC transporter permease subunit [Actinomycetales bacterium]